MKKMKRDKLEDQVKELGLFEVLELDARDLGRITGREDEAWPANGNCGCSPAIPVEGQWENMNCGCDIYNYEV